MDLSYFEQCVRNLQPEKESIINLSEYCYKNASGNENQIAKIIEKQFFGSHINHRLATFLLVYQILQQSHRRRENAFFKSLSQRTKAFISDIAGNDDPRADKEIVRVLNKWEGQGLFHPSFMKKLKDAAASCYARTAKLNQEKEVGQTFKYGKAFLMQIADLKLVDPCYRIYETYCANKKIESQLSAFYSECKKIESQTDPTVQQIKRAQQLKKVAKDHQLKLVKLIQECQTNYKLLTTVVQKEYEKLPQNLKALLEEQKKQEKN